MAKQKQGSYLEELQKIELEIDALERKKKNGDALPRCGGSNQKG